MNFWDYVAGRSIAVVGPAPMPVDQSADIDGHDLVYRIAHCPFGGPYGDRCDIAFLNGGSGRMINDDEYTAIRERIDPAQWWVFKARGYRVQGSYRAAIRPLRLTNPNAVTGMLFDLLKFDTGPITVYGADLYAGGPEGAYYEGYDVRPVRGQAEGVILHKPFDQMRIHRAIVKSGRVRGDDRYLAAVNMTDEEYRAVIDRWKAVLEEATV